ncbi:MAG: ArgE/DapE family deacylase [Verrucomicrobia bacterium]|nr:ArgE/DapE family deacylase [Verrucomicrobiota bacterium]MBV9644898.1 ArgE/DapE family deacylase [Verrucomicrobiota bacterium]
MKPELEGRIVEAVNRSRERIAQTLQELIRFESIVMAEPTRAGPGERECQNYLERRLAAAGFETDLWEPDAEALLEKYRGKPGAQLGRTFRGRPNLAGTLHGFGGGKSILLTGHIDVVPAGERTHWRHEPFSGLREAESIYGRGAVDMKGGVASMLAAAEILRDLNVPLRGDILFATVVDEEIGGMGALAMADRGYKADAGILTEPTRNRLSPLCHGILWGRILIDGIGGHAELKARHWDAGGPVDAISLMRFVLDGIDVLNARWQTDPEKNHALMELCNQIIVTQVRAGEHPSSTAGRAEIIVDVQYLPSEKDAEGLGGAVKREVEAHLFKLAQVDPWLAQHPPRVEWILDADCAEVKQDHPIIDTFAGACAGASHPFQLWGMGAHTDMGIPTGLGRTPTINFGPGDPSQAHQPNEHVSIDDLVTCTKVIALVIARWCS